MLDQDKKLHERAQSIADKMRPSDAGDDYKRGLYRKFKVERTDGRSELGEKHHGCRYFVLDVDHNQFAAAALAAYRDQCAAKFPELAGDIDRLLGGEDTFR